MDQNNQPGSSTGTGGHGATAGGGGALDDFDTFDTHYYRRDFNARTDRPATHSYDHARTGYQLGHTAAAQPSYQGRSFQDVEVELERSYKPQENSTWADVREYARSGFEWKTLVAGLALAAGGWWAGKQVAEALSHHDDEDETHYRTHYEAHPARTTVTYPQARNYYAVGYSAARNPGYAGRGYDEVEPELRRGLSGPHPVSYDTARDFYRTGYERGTTRARGGTSL